MICILFFSWHLDVDECALDATNDCHMYESAKCTNIKGSYNCTCPDGFTNEGYEGDINCTGTTYFCTDIKLGFWE